MASVVSHQEPIALYPGQSDQARTQLKARFRQYELRVVGTAESYFREQRLTHMHDNRSKGDAFFNRYRFFRLISRIIRLFLPTRVHMTVPAVDRQDPPIQPTNAKQVLVSDAMLVDSLGFNSNDCRYVDQNEKPLFDAREQGLPNQRDVVQSDSRDTCCILSAALAYCRTRNGRERFETLFKDNGDNTVTVRLWNTYKCQPVSIVVSKDRPLTPSGHDVYSFNNASNVVWPGIFEKAVHGLRLLMLSQINEDERSAEGQARTNASFVKPQLLSRHKKNVLDYINVFEGLSYLPPIGAGEDAAQGADAAWVDELNESGMNRLKQAVAEGRPVALARDLSFRNTFNALFSGIIANHAVAVLGTARCGGEDGVLIRDPYGAKVNNNGEVQLSDGQSLGWRQGDDGIQFIPWRQIPHYFNMAVEVRDRGKSVMPVEPCSSSVHETSSAVVDLGDDDLSDFDTSLL